MYFAEVPGGSSGCCHLIAFTNLYVGANFLNIWFHEHFDLNCCLPLCRYSQMPPPSDM